MGKEGTGKGYTNERSSDFIKNKHLKKTKQTICLGYPSLDTKSLRCKLKIGTKPGGGGGLAPNFGTNCEKTPKAVVVKAEILPHTLKFWSGGTSLKGHALTSWPLKQDMEGLNSGIVCLFCNTI